jgi:hypothetical protein
MMKKIIYATLAIIVIIFLVTFACHASGLKGGAPAGGATGTASGDLWGTYPNPYVVKVNGSSMPASAPLVGTNSGAQIVPAFDVIGTASLGTSAIASGACAAAVSASAAGVATTDVVTAGFGGDPTAATGYIPATTGMLTIISYPTMNNVNFKVCNNTSAPITPGAITLNWRVIR